MPGILVWSPDAEGAFDLLALARHLAPSAGGDVMVAALGDSSRRAPDFIARGADHVVTCSHELLKGLQVEPYTDALHQLITKLAPSIVLVASSIRSKDVAARVATRLEVGCGSEHSNLRIENGRLVGDRLYYSGNSILTERFTRDPQICCVAGRAYEALAADGARKGRVEAVVLDLRAPKARVASSVTQAATGVHLEDAAVVVSVGRGLKKKEDLVLVQELAKAAGGAVGCTRPIAADLKWLGDENWIGLSGHEVKPQAYIGLGVSGQIQHVAGMRGSKLIIAINKDEEAPLVKISDYAIVDDLYKVVPALIHEIQRIQRG